MIELSIIIVTHETRGILEECLASIRAHPPSHPHEVIVVDNASTDGTAEAVARGHPQVKLIRNRENLGFGRANNLGAAASAGALLLFQNSDCFALPGLYDGACERFRRDPRLGILGPALAGRDGELRQMSWGWTPSLFGEWRLRRYAPTAVQASPRLRRKVQRLQRRPRDVGLVAGACLFARRSAFEAIGRFDEAMVFFWEEPDLCLRARRAGWRVRFDPGIEAVHLLAGSSPAGLSRAAQIYRQSQLHYYRKHHGRLQNAGLRWYLRRKFEGLRRRAGTPEAQRYYQEVLEIIAGERVVDFTASRRAGQR